MIMLISALSDSRGILKSLIPATFLNAPSTADVQAPQVMPPIFSVDVIIDVFVPLMTAA